MSRTVVVNATSIGARPDGISAYGVHLVKALAGTRCGLEFEVVCNDSARARFADFEPPSEMWFRWVSDRVSPDRGSRGHIARWALAQALSWRHPRRVGLALSQIEAVRWGGPSVVTVHDVIPLLFPEHHPRQYPYYRRFLGPALSRAAAVVTPSQATRAQLMTHYDLPGAKIHVIPHGPTVPAVPRDEPRPAPKRPFILCFARPSPTKNLEALLAAFAMIKDDVSEDLVIAGVDADKALASSRSRVPLDGAKDRVRLRPNVSETEKVALLDRASAFVCTSLDEGFGLPPLEAMNRGCPVVVSRAGSLPEVCSTAAAFVDPRDPTGIAATLRRLLKDDRWRRSLVKRGFERASEFSWQASARRHVEVLERAVDAA